MTDTQRSYVGGGIRGCPEPPLQQYDVPRRNRKLRTGRLVKGFQLERERLLLAPDLARSWSLTATRNFRGKETRIRKRKRRGSQSIQFECARERKEGLLWGLGRKARWRATGRKCAGDANFKRTRRRSALLV